MAGEKKAHSLALKTSGPVFLDSSCWQNPLGRRACHKHDAEALARNADGMGPGHWCFLQADILELKTTYQVLSFTLHMRKREIFKVAWQLVAKIGVKPYLGLYLTMHDLATPLPHELLNSLSLPPLFPPSSSLYFLLSFLLSSLFVLPPLH